ncbi:alpha/beta hydrolase-fold protein [Gracilibacillus caseinilyticus]|uniref:Alpha/beta hydrolase-fold protein n=1 Tax=Gracilibacillus caseinilyticus TaxID=2932256 RepID=A0ABY4ERV2_9BACI|nr:alpha/beta hydrolase-fold protein [Gracilibacillus caseinilyticus]UOQ46954.1 alpha/beta hydrolase-fold protein [Gracilibacillus caseinilyticus]
MGRKGSMDSANIESTYLNEEIEVKWYLPEGFTPFQDYQLCVMQDGEDYFRIGRVATLSDLLHEEMEIEPTIFVGIHYHDKYDRKEKYHPDGKQQHDYIAFLVKEAIPYVEETLHITPAKRILMGDSLAGTLAFMVASQFPSTFHAAIMQSPYMNERVLQQADKVPAGSQLELYQSIGLDETEVDTTTGEISDFLAPNRSFHNALKNKLSVYHYEEFNGNHTWTYWQKDLKKILITML